ncbi:hypothetical protein [Embleya sp. NPDC005575]|uniref:hypothetical protein n=1 Tax=Embleya sp. NPDC005575 TaxID=3156892 RepID=UPI0033B2181D
MTNSGEGDTAADAPDQDARQQRRERAVGRHAERERADAQSVAEHPGEQRDPQAPAANQRGTEPHAGEHRQHGHRYEGQAGAQRAVAQAVLEVGGEDVIGAAEAALEDQDCGHGDGQAAVAEQAKRYERVAGALLDEQERAEQHDAQADRARAADRCPARIRAADQAEDEEGGAGGGEQYAGDVQAGAFVGVGGSNPEPAD